MEVQRDGMGRGRFAGRRPLAQAADVVRLRVAQLRTKVRELYFRAVLLACPCPACHRPDLAMTRDSWCRCQACGNEFDPTVTFQTCPDCGHGLSKRVCHYWCSRCRQPVRSHYCFDARVFDAAYFREMMRESRKRKQDRRAEVRKLLAASRSSWLAPDTLPDFASVPELAADLERFVGLAVIDPPVPFRLPPHFDLAAYRQHILDLVSGCSVHFDGISRIVDDPRTDRAYRFVAVVFMAHNGEIALCQETAWGEIILYEHETHRERQALH